MKTAPAARPRRRTVFAREGRSAGLLHGVPVLIKDNIDTAGLRTTYASGFFEEHIPEHDAAVVSRLRAAGAVILGKVSPA